MLEIVLMIHFIVSFLVVLLVLLQQGKGASMGAAFGGGASATLFGSRGPASFLMKLTGFLVALFFVTSLTLAYLAARSSHQQADFQPSTLAPVSSKAAEQERAHIPTPIKVDKAPK